jgi:acyl-CoA reductase-like NAD-dependent aldehyde dehydrogenase
MSTAVSETAPQASLEVRDPATGNVIASVPATQPERIQDVVQAASKVQPLWALLRVSDRARYMRRMAQAVIDDFDELVRVISQEQGRPAAEIV